MSSVGVEEAIRPRGCALCGQTIYAHTKDLTFHGYQMTRHVCKDCLVKITAEVADVDLEELLLWITKQK